MEDEQRQSRNNLLAHTWGVRIIAAKEKTDALQGLLGLLWSSQAANPQVMELYLKGIRGAWPLALEGIRDLELYLRDLRSHMEYMQQQGENPLRATNEVSPPGIEDVEDRPMKPAFVTEEEERDRPISLSVPFPNIP